MAFHLVPSAISHDTVDAARSITEAAESGEITGFAIVVFLRRRRFLVDACGDAARDPVLARGALKDLDDLLRDIARGQRDSPTIT